MRIRECTLIGLFFASCAANASPELNMTPGVSPVSHEMYNLHMTILWICVVIGIIVFGTIFYSILFHRKSIHPRPARFHEHLWVELTWSFIPLLILILMAIPATKVLLDLNNFDKPDITIKITGYQWKWRYDYLDQGFGFFSNLSTPYDQLNGTAKKGEYYLREVDHPLVVPIHKKIRFVVTSNDVIHSWWVPDLGIKRDAIPGFINEAWTRINRAGTYRGQCSSLCGINHAYMAIVVEAKTDKDFDDWVVQQKGGTVVPTVTAGAPVTTPHPTPAASTSPTGGEVKSAAPAPAPAAAPAASAAPAAPAAPAAVPTTAPAVAPAAPAAPAGPGKKYTLDELMKMGEQVYMRICVACHQPNGEGLPPTYPSLKNSPIATGPLPQHLDRVLNGKPGTAMQAFKDQLSDDELAGVITYERHSFGNPGKELVQPDDIKAARQGAHS